MDVLVVDGSRQSAAAVALMLDEIPDLAVEICLDPREVVERCHAQRFDLLLVGDRLSGLDAMELVERLRGGERCDRVPVIMVTSGADEAFRLKAIEAGATDFLTRPFGRVELQARARNLLALRRARLQLDDRAGTLLSQVEAATHHLVRREEEVIWRLARAIEYRDGTTGEHISRVAMISRLIAEGLGLGEDRVRIIYLAAPLHDIGKIGVSDAILQKPGRLTPDELAIMRRHVDIGCDILTDGSSDLIRVAALIAGAHHERWDGQGYPSGLAGEAIPLEGRIVAVADVFDALCSQRPYKKAWPVEDAYAEILAGSGSHFDPRCVAAFEAKWPQIRRIVAGSGGSSLAA